MSTRIAVPMLIGLLLLASGCSSASVAESRSKIDAIKPKAEDALNEELKAFEAWQGAVVDFSMASREGKKADVGLMQSLENRHAETQARLDVQKEKWTNAIQELGEADSDAAHDEQRLYKDFLARQAARKMEILQKVRTARGVDPMTGMKAK